MGFSNKSEDLCKNMYKLPEILVDIIYTYVPKSVTMFLTKKKYMEDHHNIRQLIDKRKIEQYIRAMVRDDNDFVFKHLLKENYVRWLNMRKYYYKECIYGNYVNFLESYAIDNKSTNCRRILIDFFEEQGLSKNQHKKNTIRYIRWKT
jgi:hypothetical protein